MFTFSQLCFILELINTLSLPRYYSHNNDYLEICRCYKAIYDIPAIKEDPSKWIPVLSPPPCPYNPNSYSQSHMPLNYLTI